MAEEKNGRRWIEMEERKGRIGEVLEKEEIGEGGRFGVRRK
jgi:hypothetical protein